MSAAIYDFKNFKTKIAPRTDSQSQKPILNMPMDQLNDNLRRLENKLSDIESCVLEANSVFENIIIHRIAHTKEIISKCEHAHLASNLEDMIKIRDEIVTQIRNFRKVSP